MTYVSVERHDGEVWEEPSADSGEELRLGEEDPLKDGRTVSLTLPPTQRLVRNKVSDRITLTQQRLSILALERWHLQTQTIHNVSLLLRT
jgi:hypothetical protein